MSPHKIRIYLKHFGEDTDFIPDDQLKSFVKEFKKTYKYAVCKLNHRIYKAGKIILTSLGL